MAIPFFAFRTLTKQTGGGGGTTNYNNLSNKPKINGHELTGSKTSEDLEILTYKKLEVKDSPLGIYDGEKKLTLAEVRSLYADDKYYLFLEYLNIVFIPGARQADTSSAFEFFGGFQNNGKAYHCRVIINNENVVRYNQIEIEDTENKVEEIDEDEESNNVLYPNVSAVIDYVKNHSGDTPPSGNLYGGDYTSTSTYTDGKIRFEAQNESKASTVAVYYLSKRQFLLQGSFSCSKASANNWFTVGYLRYNNTRISWTTTFEVVGCDGNLNPALVRFNNSYNDFRFIITKTPMSTTLYINTVITTKFDLY